MSCCRLTWTRAGFSESRVCRCEASNGNAVTIPAVDAIQALAVPAGTTWANPTLLAGDTPNSGASAD